MIVLGGSTDVSVYFVLRLAATGVEATALDVTTFDLQYVRTGVAPVAKADATALAATDSAHADNKAIEIDATDQPGLYRVDFPDAAFAAGVKQVILTVKCATCFTEHMAIDIDVPVPWNAAWDAEVQSEATDALNAYDPPTKTEMDTAIGDVPTAAEVKTAIEAAGSHLALILADTGTDGVPLTAAAIDAIYEETQVGHVTAGTYGKTFNDRLADISSILVDTGTTLDAELTIARKILTNKWAVVNNQLIVYDDDGTTVFRTFNLKNSAGGATNIRVFSREPA